MPSYYRKKTGKGYRTKTGRKNYVKKVVKDTLAKELELKKSYFTGTISLTCATPGTTNVQYLDLGQIAQGTTNAQRIGNKIKIHSIRWRLGCSHSSNGGILRVSAVRTKTNAFANGSIPVNMETNWDKERVTVLTDRVYPNDTTKLWKLITGRCKGNTLVFDDSTTGSATKGTTFLAFLFAAQTGVAQTFGFGYQVEVTYTDA